MMLYGARHSNSWNSVARCLHELYESRIVSALCFAVGRSRSVSVSQVIRDDNTRCCYSSVPVGRSVVLAFCS